MRKVKLQYTKLVLVTLMAMVGGLMAGCDDAASGDEIDMGAGGMGGEGGGGEVAIDTFLFTSLSMSEPEIGRAHV